MLLRSFLLLFITITTLCSVEKENTNTLTNHSAVAFVYHRFGESKYPSTNITLKQFQAQLDYLRKHNYNVWSLSKIINTIKNRQAIPPKTVSLTMDDAYYSVYTNAYPLLKAQGYPFTVFVNTDPIDRGFKSHITWDQMRQMQKDGAEFFNHSKSHDYLLKKGNETQQEAKKRIKKEILLAQKRLDQELGKKSIKLLAYPFGEYDLQTKNLLRTLGVIGVSQTSGPLGAKSDFQALSRFPMAEKFASMDGFKTKLNTLQLPIESVSLTTPVLEGENPPTLLIQLEKPLLNISCFLSSGERLQPQWIDKKSFKVKALKPLQGERELYTCTAPAKNGKWYWYSHLFIVDKR